MIFGELHVLEDVSLLIQKVQFVHILQMKCGRVTEGHSAQGECAFYCRNYINLFFSF